MQGEQAARSAWAKRNLPTLHILVRVNRWACLMGNQMVNLLQQRREIGIISRRCPFTFENSRLPCAGTQAQFCRPALRISRINGAAKTCSRPAFCLVVEVTIDESFSLTLGFIACPYYILRIHSLCPSLSILTTIKIYPFPHIDVRAGFLICEFLQKFLSTLEFC